MSGFGKVYRGENDFDFPRIWRPLLIVSVVLLGISAVSLVRQGLNLAIDFQGGAVFEVASDTLTVDEAREVLGPFGKEDGSKVQEVTDATGKRILRVQADVQNVNDAQPIAQAFADKVGVPVTEIGTNTVGPSWGSEITGQAVKSLVIFLIIITLYISWQLEWRMAAAALAAVVHDVGLTVGFYSVFQIQVTPATVISFLTILGFSLYDTIVVYDRVKENAARFDRSSQYTYKGIMRRSLNQVLMRSANTTIVTLLPVLSMLVIGALIYRQPVLQDFSLALLIGLFSGAYSSIFVAPPLTVWLKEREQRYARIRARAIERGDLESAEHIPVSVGATGGLATARTRATPVAVAADGATSPGTVTPAVRASQYERPHPPRPRKQGKKR